MTRTRAGLERFPLQRFVRSSAVMRCSAASVSASRERIRGCAQNADADDVDPALGEIGDVRVEQRADDILRHDDQPEPRHRRRRAEQRQVREPHRQQHAPRRRRPVAPPPRGSGCADWPSPARRSRPARPRRAGTAFRSSRCRDRDRRFGDELGGLAPEFQPLSGRGLLAALAILHDLIDEVGHPHAQIGRRRPSDARQLAADNAHDDRALAAEPTEAEHDEQDRHHHQRGAAGRHVEDVGDEQRGGGDQQQRVAHAVRVARSSVAWPSRPSAHSAKMPLCAM